jgi:transposase InsO family protein
MVQKVTGMDIRIASTFTGHVNVAGYCRAQGISRTAFYKWRQRFLEGGIDGLVERSRRPLSCPGQTAAEVEEMVLRRRKQLLEQGLDHGPQSIRWSLQRQGCTAVPSRATIARILTRSGAITPQPRKRPRSATKRFVFDRPNECWQSDWTEWHLADGAAVAIAGSLDDHSRYVAGLAAALGAGTGELVWAVFLAGVAECGVPSMSLSDNGLMYTGRFRGYEAAFEINLRALGVRPINSAPYHPQTCGKIERFWQTLKKWLRARPAATTLAELNALLADFRDFYNHHRPHRALRGATPAEAVTATTKARPADRPLPAPVFVSRATVGPDSGALFVPPYKVNVGLRWGGHDCVSIRDGNYICIFSGNRLIRAFTADPTRNYQPGDKTTRTYGNREPQPAS